jgi:hypothetical protein
MGYGVAYPANWVHGIQGARHWGMGKGWSAHSGRFRPEGDLSFALKGRSKAGAKYMSENENKKTECRKFIDSPPVGA